MKLDGFSEVLQLTLSAISRHSIFNNGPRPYARIPRAMAVKPVVSLRGMSRRYGLAIA